MGIDPIENGLQAILTSEISKNRVMIGIFPLYASQIRWVNVRLEGLSDDLRTLLEHLKPNSPWSVQQTSDLLEAIRRIHVDCVREVMRIATTAGGPAAILEQCNALADEADAFWAKFIESQKREYNA
jgi:hypothetical protein